MQGCKGAGWVWLWLLGVALAVGCGEVDGGGDAAVGDDAFDELDSPRAFEGGSDERVAAYYGTGASCTAVSFYTAADAAQPWIAASDVDTRRGYLHPFDGVLPFEMPYPRDGLLMHSPAGIGNYGHRETFAWQTPPALVEDASGRGKVAQFDATSVAGPGTWIPDWSHGDGLTVALWYRAHDVTAQLQGHNPLVSAGAPYAELFSPGGPWDYLQLYLDDGIPTVSLSQVPWVVLASHGGEAQSGGAGRVDDGQWHHLALVIKQQCQDPTDGCRTGLGNNYARVRLYVDRHLVDETSVALEKTYREVRLGAMLAPVIGASSLPNYQPRSPVWHHNVLTTRGQVDDIFIYNRALSGPEISRVASSAERGVLAVWPAVAPSAWGHSHEDAGWPDDFDPGLEVATDVAISDLVRIPSPGALATDAVALELDGQQGYGLAVWMRPGTDQDAWLEAIYDQAGTQRFRVTLTSDGYAQLAVNGGDVGESMPLPPLNLGGNPVIFGRPWRLVTVSNVRGVHHVTVDGRPLGYVAPCTQAGFNEHSSAAVGDGHLDEHFKVALGGNGLSVAWAALFDAAADIPSMVAAARPGPSLWLGADDVLPLDYLALSTPMLDDDNAWWVRTPGALEARADVGGIGEFTASMRFELSNAGQSSPYKRINLLNRWRASPDDQERLDRFNGAPRVADVRVELDCALGQCSPLTITVPDPVTGELAQHSFVSGDLGFDYDQVHHLVISWPSLDESGQPVPRVSLDGRKLWSDPDVRHYVATSLGPNPHGDTWWQAGREPDTSEVELDVTELRLYPYAVQAPEEVDARCADLTCQAQGRACVERKDATLVGAVCTDCLPTHYPLLSRRDGRPTECAPRAGVGSHCISGQMCLGDDACSVDRMCGTEDEAEAEAYCRTQGRAHISRPTLDGGQTWTCSGCLPHHVIAPDQEGRYGVQWSDVRCVWAPELEIDAVCSGDDEVGDWSCTSGLCHCTPETSFGHPPTTPVPEVCRCAARSADECTSRGRQAVASGGAYNGVGRPATTAWLCNGDAMVCRNHFEKDWTILSPAACQHARTSSSTYPHDFSSFTSSSDAAEGVKVLKRLFLADTSEPASGDFGRLADVGVGALLYHAVTSDDDAFLDLRDQYGQMLPIQKCVDDPTSAYYSQHNRQTCVPQRLTDGATCPPADETEQPGQAHRWCRSGYCHRSRKVCAPGGAGHKKTGGDTGNNQNADAKPYFGILRNDTTDLHVTDKGSSKPGHTPTQAELDAWKFKLSQKMHYDIYMFGERLPVSLLALDLAVDKTKGANCSQGSADIKVLGFKLNGDPPKPLVGCAGPQGTTDAYNGSFDTYLCEDAFHCEATNPFEHLLEFKPSVDLAFCIPMPEALDKLKKKQSLVEETGLPLSAEAGLSFDLCFGFNVAFANGLPQFVFRPSAGIGAYVKAGLGLADDALPFEFWAGVQAAITIYEIALPFTFGLALDAALHPDGNQVQALFELALKGNMSLVNTFLSGWMGVFAELGFLFFSLEKHWAIFEWAGFSHTVNILDVELFKKTIDLHYSFDPASAP